MSEGQKYDVPGTHEQVAFIESTAAADATKTRVIFVAPVSGKIEKVKVVPDTAITGADTDTKHLNLIDRGTTGAGSTELASIDLVSGTDIGVAGANLYAPATPLSVSQGNQLAIQVEKIGTGQALPPLHVEVEFAAN